MVNNRLTITSVEDMESDALLLKLAASEEKLEWDISVIGESKKIFEYIDMAGNGAGHAVPDAFIMDLKIPKTSGKDLIAYMRQNEKLSGVPVFVLTSSDAPADMDALKGMGVRKFYTKPLIFADFKKVLADIDSTIRAL